MSLNPFDLCFAVTGVTQGYQVAQAVVSANAIGRDVVSRDRGPGSVAVLACVLIALSCGLALNLPVWAAIALSATYPVMVTRRCVVAMVAPLGAKELSRVPQIRAWASALVAALSTLESHLMVGKCLLASTVTKHLFPAHQRWRALNSRPTLLTRTYALLLCSVLGGLSRAGARAVFSRAVIGRWAIKQRAAILAGNRMFHSANYSIAKG